MEGTGIFTASGRSSLSRKVEISRCAGVQEVSMVTMVTRGRLQIVSNMLVLHAEFKVHSVTHGGIWGQPKGRKTKARKGKKVN